MTEYNREIIDFEGKYYLIKMYGKDQCEKLLKTVYLLVIVSKLIHQFGIAFFLLLLLLLFWNCTLKKEYQISESRVQFDRVTFFFHI